MKKSTKLLAQQLGIRTNQRQKGLFDEVSKSKSKPKQVDNTWILQQIKERELVIDDEKSKQWMLDHPEI